MSSVSSSARHGWLGSAATTSVEFALVLTAFLWLLLGTIDLARYFLTVQAVVGLLGEAGRVSLMDPNWAPCGNNSWTDIATISPLLDASQVYLCVYQGESGVGPNTVSLTVSYPFTPYTPGLGGLAGTITEATSYSY
ncbi:MAG: TadE family protein [Acetobacteraceae bacterium]|jgi:hypothetical protein